MSDAEQVDEAAGSLIGIGAAVLLVLVLAPILVVTTVAGWVWQRFRWPFWSLLGAATGAITLVALTGQGPGYIGAYHAAWQALSTEAGWPGTSVLLAQAAPVAFAGGLAAASGVVGVQRLRAHRAEAAVRPQEGDDGPGLRARLRGWWHGRRLDRQPTNRRSAALFLSECLLPKE